MPNMEGRNPGRFYRCDFLRTVLVGGIRQGESNVTAADERTS